MTQSIPAPYAMCMLILLYNGEKLLQLEILTVEIKSSVVFADENFGGGGRGGGTFWVGEAAAVILSAITVTS